jgi:4-hydroxybenzoate polyprenyltransferase
VIIPFFVGYFYSKKIVIGKYSFKLKGGMGTKNLIVALTWGIFITGVVMKGHSDPIATISIFSFLFIKSLINTVMEDFSDVTGDKIAGLMTLPICLGEEKTRYLLMGIHMFEHVIIAIIMIKGMLEFEIIILLSCFFSGVIYIFFFTRTSININSSRIKNVSYQLFYRWEFYVAVGLQTLSKILV